LKLRFHKGASKELQEAADWYEEQAGIGDEFLEEVHLATEAMLETPSAWPVWTEVKARGPVRRFILPRFPFTLPYVVLEGGVIHVLAVAHTKRRPAYWLKRLEP
jgi:hypothetical protein